MGPAQRSQWQERALAIAIASLLTLAWTVADRARLSALILPDPDDMMRLVQIRDWLGGQSFVDLTQYRLGSGLAMHWSRLPDLVPAAVIVALEPLAGRQGAEIAAVVAWPALLFAAALALLGDAARRMSDNREAGLIAVLLGAIAYPATGFFTPGRIDHHGLQLVLLLLAARAILAGPGWRAGLASGLATAASLKIGLESAPLCALVLAALALRWAIGGGRGATLAAAGTGLAGGTALAAVFLRPGVWRADLCDAFTPPVATLAMLAGALLAIAGFVGSRWTSGAVRLALLGAAGVVLLAMLPWLAPACLAGPYGAIPPLLRALWLDQVAEAQPLLAMPAGVILAYAGLMIVGTAVAAWQIYRHDVGRAERLGWLAVQIGALLLSCVQLRLAPFGAALAVPVMAAWIAQVRKEARPLSVAGAWALSAGILYPLAAMLVPAKPEPPRAACLTAENLRAIAATGARRVAVPLDMGAYVIANSDAAVLAAPYHRNTDANLAHYRLFLGSPALAVAEARRWKIGAIAYCPDWLNDLDALSVAAPGSIVATAGQGGAPDWTVATRRPGLVILVPRR